MVLLLPSIPPRIPRLHKKHKPQKKSMLTTRSGTQIHPLTNFNELLDMTTIEVVQSTILICTPPIPFRWQTAK